MTEDLPQADNLVQATTMPLPKVMEVHLKLANYPILADRIRERMREEIFARGIISREVFEQEVKDKAVVSQQREGLHDPLTQESLETWERRKRQISDHLTDFYYAYNLPQRLLDEIIQAEVGSHEGESLAMTFNPELAPWDMLLAKGRQYETLPPDRRAAVQHHLQELKVVLIKAMISDQLAFVGIAKEFFSIADLQNIRRHRIGRGKIGGKAAGLMLAWKILQKAGESTQSPLLQHLAMPESYFVGADVFYQFLELNGLLENVNQKYKTPEQMIQDYKHLPRRFAEGRFPDSIVDDLQALLEGLGPVPLIVRSSSLLEDNVTTSFAGKYESVFCPNQGTPQENLENLLLAISQVYASALNPDALLYRQRMGLIDYDERMAVILQKVQGSQHGRYFFPTVAGVAFSRNPFLWTPRLRREEGFVRAVVGLGTRAVDRVPDDYPRMIGLSHPTLRPEREAHKIHHYSQHFADIIDLEANAVRTLPVGQVIGQDFPWLRLVGSLDRGTYVEAIRSAAMEVRPQELVITLASLLERTDFVRYVKEILQTLERAYACPVDVEFTVEVTGSVRQPQVTVHILQCRPQSSQDEAQAIRIPRDVPEVDTLFTADYLVPNGLVTRVRYIVYVDPLQYARLSAPSDRLEIARAVGRLNRALKDEQFILMGPGRWGSSNLDLGVKVTYADIFNTRMLIELGMNHGRGTPELAHGTHFFQDLVEARIFPLALFPDQPETAFNKRFFSEASNKLSQLSPEDAVWDGIVKVIDLAEARNGKLLEVVMSGDEGEAIGYLKRYD